MITSVGGKDEEESKHFHPTDGNTSQYSHCGKQFGGSLIK